MKTVVSEGVREIWLSSEDTGAYGNLDVQFFLYLLMTDTCGNYRVKFTSLACKIFRTGHRYKSSKFVKCDCCGASC